MTGQNRCKEVVVAIRITGGAEWDPDLERDASELFKTLEASVTSEVSCNPLQKKKDSLKPCILFPLQGIVKGLHVLHISAPISFKSQSTRGSKIFGNGQKQPYLKLCLLKASPVT